MPRGSKQAIGVDWLTHQRAVIEQARILYTHGFSEAEKPGLIEQLNVGDSFSLIVAEIHPRDRKIVLGPGNTRDEGAWKNYADDAATEPMSDLAEKMKQAIKSKKDK